LVVLVGLFKTASLLVKGEVAYIETLGFLLLWDLHWITFDDIVGA